jgi:hypothetical protein
MRQQPSPLQTQQLVMADQQRRRYRHLYPDVEHEAMLAVFAGLQSA